MESDHGQSRSRLRCFEPYDYVRMAVGLLLLTAAAFKIHELVTRPVSSSFETGFFRARWVQFALIEAELILFGCLLLDLWHRFTWTATLLLFGGFSVYSLTSLASGEETCGCFGSLRADPFWMLLVDTSVIASLCLFRPRKGVCEPGISGNALTQSQTSHCTQHSLIRISTTLCLALMPLIAAPVALRAPATEKTSLGLTIFEGGIAMVEPEEWIGKQLPLLDYIDEGASLALGNTTLLFYRHDCHACLELLESLGDETSHATNGSDKVVLVQVPSNSTHGGPRHGRAHLRLSSNIAWIIPTPLQIILRSGEVQSVEQGAAITL